MTIEEFEAIFENRHEEFLKDANIEASRRLSVRPDLNAFLLLDKLVPGGKTDMMSWAGHDEIALDTAVLDLINAVTEEDILDLIRCGVRYSKDSLMMFA